MNALNVTLGVLSIIVSVVVGLLTFYVADRRSRRNRWQNAKDTISRELSKSLGEGNVPSREVIAATIRSVLSGHNPGAVEAVTVDEVIDDLIRQIISDPFLDATKRKQLQSEILAVKAQRPVQAPPTATQPPEGERPSISKMPELISLLLGVFASLLAAVGTISGQRLIDLLKENMGAATNFLLPLASVLITLVIGAVMMLLKERSKTSRSKDDERGK